MFGEIIPCEASEDCLNAPQHRGGIRLAHCGSCRFAPSNDNRGSMQWKPALRGAKHPVQVEEATAALAERNQERAEKRRHRNPRKVKLASAAVLAEQQTSRNFAGFFTDTRNSGRSHQDGDHRSTLAKVHLDTKLQSKRVHPVVDLGELQKIQDQAAQNNSIGGLVIRNKHGKGVVVFAENDYKVLFGKHLFGLIRQGVDEAEPEQ